MRLCASRKGDDMNKTDLMNEFLSPSPEFSPMPFWFWNDDLSEEEIARQIREFKSKGVNGFVIHPRIGLPESIPYMSDSWLHYVRFAVEQAKSLQMRVMLYDEAMYPSGSCHGEVVRTNPQYASVCLEMRNVPDCSPGETLIAQIDKGGKHFFFFECFSGGTIRGIHFGEDDGQPGAPKSADLLNPDAVACFIRLTHEKYYQALSEHFGDTVVGIFTDEPMICGRGSKKVPWTPGFLDGLCREGFREDDLIYLFDDRESEEARRARDIFHAAIRKRLQESFYRQIAGWCKAHKIALVGHPEKSTDIALLQDFDVPCQDIVWRYIAPANGSGITGRHSTMAKCASDSARHRGRRRNGNECFGCCGHEDDPYAFTYEDMKWYLDWLFVRGCNLIIPHAFFYSLRGARREERPPDVGMNSCFWNEYGRISDYIKRCSAVNTDSVNVTDVAILCGADDLPWRAAKDLYEAQTEFNYLEYELLKECRIGGGRCHIAGNSYKVLITDGIYSESSAAYLKAFVQGGGILLDYDGCPDFCGRVHQASDTVLHLARSRDLRITHVKKYGTDILFCTNEGEKPVHTVINERITAVLDAETGTVCPHLGNEFVLDLLPRKSLHLILDRKASSPA